jgi:hypothetical protein
MDHWFLFPALGPHYQSETKWTIDFYFQHSARITNLKENGPLIFISSTRPTLPIWKQMKTNGPLIFISRTRPALPIWKQMDHWFWFPALGPHYQSETKWTIDFYFQHSARVTNLTQNGPLVFISSTRPLQGANHQWWNAGGQTISDETQGANHQWWNAGGQTISDESKNKFAQKKCAGTRWFVDVPVRAVQHSSSAAKKERSKATAQKRSSAAKQHRSKVAAQQSSSAAKQQWKFALDGKCDGKWDGKCDGKNATEFAGSL